MDQLFFSSLNIFYILKIFPLILDLFFFLNKKLSLQTHTRPDQFDLSQTLTLPSIAFHLCFFIQLYHWTGWTLLRITFGVSRQRQTINKKEPSLFYINREERKLISSFSKFTKTQGILDHIEDDKLYRPASLSFPSDAPTIWTDSLSPPNCCVELTGQWQSTKHA